MTGPEEIADAAAGERPEIVRRWQTVAATAAAERPRVACCADEGVDCASCLTGHCPECPECSRYEPRHGDDE